MSKQQHTHGIWFTESEERNSIDNLESIWVSVVGGGRVCEVYANCMVKTDEELRANARLIAAAPELLAFAEEWLASQGNDANYMTAKARAAIRKAKGE